MQHLHFSSFPFGEYWHGQSGGRNPPPTGGSHGTDVERTEDSFRFFPLALGELQRNSCQSGVITSTFQADTNFQPTLTHCVFLVSFCLGGGMKIKTETCKTWDPKTRRLYASHRNLNLPRYILAPGCVAADIDILEQKQQHPQGLYRSCPSLPIHIPTQVIKCCPHKMLLATILLLKPAQGTEECSALFFISLIARTL